MDMVIGLIGVIIGALASWLIARHYYRQASIYPPAWAKEQFDTIITTLPKEQPEGDFDLVKIFEKGLK